MTVTFASGSVIAQPGQQFALSSLITPGAGLPSIIGLDLFDDGNYALSNPGTLGSLSGNGARSTVSYVDGIGKDFTYLIFQYDPKAGAYYNSTLGYWNDITVTAPTGTDHAEMLTVFSFKNGTTLAIGNLTDLGDLSIMAGAAGTAAGQATPAQICAIAQSYVGKVWNNNGCALLVQDIAALAGTTAPFTEVASSPTPQQPFAAQPNSPWIVAYDGGTQADPSIAAVEAMIRPGDIVNLSWEKGGGHCFTVVSGSGAGAQVIDNWDFGSNKADDGSAADIVITAAHSLDTLLRQEGGAIPASVEVYRLDTPVIAAQAIAIPAAGQGVADSAENVAAALDGLAALAAKGQLASISLTDEGIPDLTVTAAQFSADAAALNDIGSAHTVTVRISGSATQHDFSGENWVGASALQFADQTVIVAAPPGAASAVTTGNVTELYSAVLAREPDIGGLAFYRNYLENNPSTPLIQFAEWFLSSSEYSSAHTYAQTTAGDTQFIIDSYRNLLNRAPEQSEIDFYLANVLEKPGSQVQNHAQMLVYFSASAEFLSDVQITAANPAGAHHWLLLT